MAVPSPAPRAPSEFDRLKSFVKRHPIPVAIVLVVGLVLTPSIVYYGMSYNSVNGTHPELVTGYRSVGYISATFYLTIHVWSWGGSLDTQVTSPAFTLTVDNLPFGTQVDTSGSFQPNNYVTYTVTFETQDRGIIQTVGASSSSSLVLQMSADVSAGWYHELITRTDSLPNVHSSAVHRTDSDTSYNVVETQFLCTPQIDNAATWGTVKTR